MSSLISQSEDMRGAWQHQQQKAWVSGQFLFWFKVHTRCLNNQPGHACALLLVNLGCFVALQEDKDALSQLANEFEIDFVSLSFTRSREDVTAARDYLDSLGMVHTKVGLGQNPVLAAGSSRAGDLARHQLGGGSRSGSSC